jgi:LysR family transcriptional regulator, glycine cleavage system transcriptional activator
MPGQRHPANSFRGSHILIGLRDFEAAARSGSFAAAGLELGISASAVSQQVKSLEAHLGTLLFDRKPQSLSLTTPGRKLMIALTSAFELIDNSLSTFRPPQETMLLPMPAIFAASWFLPRMKNFRTSYRRFEVVPRSSGALREPSPAGASACVRYGRAGWHDLDCRFLFNEIVCPMCSPAYLKERLAGKAPEYPSILVSEDRLGVWDDWARATKGLLNATNVSVFGDDLLVVQAAMNDHGLALLDRNLLSRQLALGHLVELPDMPRWETGEGWYLAFEERGQMEEGLVALMDWLLLEVSADTSATT